VGRGVLYLALSATAIGILFGRDEPQADQHGALSWLADQPFGSFLLVATAAAFVCYALWRVVQAALDPADEADDDWAGRAKRVVWIVRAVSYTALAWLAFNILRGGDKGSGASDTSRDVTARLLQNTAGRGLVVAAGIVLLGIAGYQIWKVLSGRVRRRLHEDDELEGVAARVVEVGYFARGVVVGLVGLFVIHAAMQGDPDEAAGLDGALRTLAGDPAGAVLLALCAAALATFGLASIIEARLRRIT
jgi:hypothetical protein